MKSKRKDNEEKDDNRSQPSAREILMKAGRKRSTSKKDKILGKKTEVKKMDSGSDKDSSESKSSRPGRRKSAPDQKEGRAARSTESTRGRGSKTDKPDRNSGRTGRGTRDSKKGKKIRSASSQEPSQRVKQADYLREEIRLNKYIAHAGLCSRREADEYIEQGKVKVNGVVVTELGSKVKSTDNVEVEKQKLSLEPFVYILLNKGRDTISTTDDEKDRNTVVDAIEGATGHRVYPVGRLDRNTMGILILTNDGDLAHRLMHPSYSVKKTYEVTSSRKLSDEELERLRAGVTLEDGPVNPTSVQRDPVDPYVINITVLEGRNHLIRRMIGHLGADVSKLVRVRYAGLTEKNTRVGRWRFLKQKEINDLRRLVKLDALSFNKS
jgi:23S rRNA pseudouridine2605 synthase